MHTRYQRTSFTWLAYLLLALYGYFLNILGPLTPYLKTELALSYTVASLHFSAFAGGILLAGFAGHKVVIRLGRWRSLWVAALGLSAGALLLATGVHPIQTIAGSFVMGSVGSLILVIIPAALSDQFGVLRAVALSEANVISSLVAAAAPLLVGWLAAYPAGWRLAVGCAALLAGLLFVGFGKIQPPPAAAQNDENGIRQGASAPWFWIYWTALVFAVSVEFCLISWSADFLEVEIGLAKASAAQSVSLFLGGMIIGRLAGSWLVQIIPAVRLVIGFVLAAALGFSLFWFANSAFWALSGLFICGAGVASLYPLIVSMAIETADNAVIASARATIASGTAILALPLTIGRLADTFGIHRAYGVVFILLAGILLIALAGVRRHNRLSVE